MPEIPIGQPVSAPVRRRYPDAPLVGVGVAIFDAGGRVLLVQRGRPPRAGHWGLPGGLLDVGEKLTDGARREVSEECAVEIEIGGVAGIFEPISYDDRGQVEYHYVVIDFWASHIGGVPVAADDAAAVAWVPLDELACYNLLPDSHKVIVDAHAAWRQAQAGR
jgi:8-oxo-dGTP diphosphatase